MDEINLSSNPKGRSKKEVIIDNKNFMSYVSNVVYGEFK